MDARIKLGSRVYLRLAIAGAPGVVSGFDRQGYALVDWVDMPEIGRWTAHDPESLVVDEAFTVRQLDLFEIAA
jgi:hypothetical protein